jgi:hypothetical protein
VKELDANNGVKQKRAKIKMTKEERERKHGK